MTTIPKKPDETPALQHGDGAADETTPTPPEPQAAAAPAPRPGGGWSAARLRSRRFGRR